MFRALGVFCAVLTVLTSLACSRKANSGKPESSTAGQDRLRVVTTTGIIGDIAANIAGERADVISLMGPGVDPHLYKASAGDVRRLQQANLILFNGLHLEARLGEVLEHILDIPSRAVANSLDESDLIGNPSFGGVYDPHVWFDVSLWTKVAGVIAESLTDVDPESGQIYRRNLEAYRTKLNALDKEVRSISRSIPRNKRILITAHDAFQYFGLAYEFDVRGLQGISTVTEAGAKDVQSLALFIVDNRIPSIFIESSIPRRNIEALQKAVRDRGFDVRIGGELFSDALGERGTVEGTYIGMIRHNIKTIAAGLKEPAE